MTELYKQRIALAKRWMAVEELERVPFFPSIQTWGIWYGGGTTEEVLGHPKKELECYGKLLRDMPIDGIPIFGHNSPGFLAQSMGFCKTKISEDKVTVQTSDEHCIYDGELQQFVDDPFGFLLDVALPRKYPALQGSEEAGISAVQAAIKYFLSFKIRGIYINKLLAKNYDTPMLADAPMTMPFDILLPMRGFKGTVLDARRNPELLAAATERLYSFCKPMGKCTDYPFKICPMIGATYLNPKQFEQIYWPTCRKVLQDYIEAGAKCVLFLEGKWRTHIEKFMEFPKGSIALMLDEDDPEYVKNLVGDRFAICYGIPSSIMRTGTPEDVKAHAEALVKKMGNKGTALSFCSALLSPGDAKKENVLAAAEFCRDFRF